MSCLLDSELMAWSQEVGDLVSLVRILLCYLAMSLALLWLLGFPICEIRVEVGWAEMN